VEKMISVSLYEGIIVEGVAAILYNNKNNVLAVQEGKRKLWKEPRQWGVPMGLLKSEWETSEEAVSREIYEETPGVSQYEFKEKKTFVFHSKEIMGIIKAFIVKVEMCDDEKNRPTEEILDYRWIRPEDLLKQNLRIGVKELIEWFIKEKIGFSLTKKARKVLKERGLLKVGKEFGDLFRQMTDEKEK
jgi:ADP-ribose pyrophosphatase YjhB (NUDIX family)